MRVKLFEKDLIKLFSKILKEKGGLNHLVSLLGISRRTLNDWKNGKTTIPIESFEKIVEISDLKIENLRFEILPDFWYTRDAGRKGGYAQMQLHGNFGTPEGRRKGGLASIATHMRKKTGFKTLKSIKNPEFSSKLAELLGILFGDGHLSHYQVSVTTNSETDGEHALFTCQLINELFSVWPSIKKKRGENTINVIVSSKKMVDFLNKIGMPIGNKIQNNLRIPKWIFKNISYKKAFIRGLFDTDGCIYIDIHRNKNKEYKHFGWTITSYADNLIGDIIKVLSDLKFSPTHRISQKSVYLRRQDEIKRYFDEIGSNNHKHLKRFNNDC